MEVNKTNASTANSKNFPNLTTSSFSPIPIVLRLGNIVPDFSCETTQGNWKSFHQWKQGKWAILFSHPADFTPGMHAIGCKGWYRLASRSGEQRILFSWCTHDPQSLSFYLNSAVCTTEIASLAKKYGELCNMDCLVATLSVDPVASHKEWLHDVVAHSESGIAVKFPIIADESRDISTAYGMIDPWTSDRQDLPLTIR
jgi:1-Cys peroxiredoxin 6